MAAPIHVELVKRAKTIPIGATAPTIRKVVKTLGPDQIQTDSFTLQVWMGDDSKDEITAEQWVERVQGAKDVSNWTDEQTLSYIYKALRGKALAWYGTLQKSSTVTWIDFKKAFTRAYCKETSAKTNSSIKIVNYQDLFQRETETVMEFYSRVVHAVYTLESNAPQIDLPNPAYPRALTSEQSFLNLHPKNKRNAAIRLVKHGAQEAYNYLSLNIFVSGLKKSIQEELLKEQLSTIYNALEISQELEKKEAEEPVSTIHVVQLEEFQFITSNVEDDDDDDSSTADDDEDCHLRSNSPVQMLEDIGIDDNELRKIATKDLNKLLKKRKIDEKRQKEIKQRRRTLKNRGYAANCRTKRDIHEEQYKDELEQFEREISIHENKNETTEAEVIQFMAKLITYGFSQEHIKEIKENGAMPIYDNNKKLIGVENPNKGNAKVKK